MIYADANVIIRLMEGDAATVAPLMARLLPFRGMTRFLCTSRLSRLECRVKPLRAGDNTLLARYDAFFSAVEVAVLDVTAAVLDTATDLRAALNLKTPDAIHLATANIAGVTAFLTGDKDLARCTAVPVVVL